jgi:NTP pyrophosphatase (non-canonical NTP hydrolase)
LRRTNKKKFNPMTIQQAQETVDTWIRTIGVRYFSELTNTAILMEEVGEVARLMARLYGEQSFKNTEKADTAREDLADEMADVLFVLICLANQTGTDLTEALRKNLEKKTGRDAERHARNEKLQ